MNQNNALDFDDLLLRTAHAFRDHPEVLRELQERFQYLLIDEYQDTNHAQYVIAHALAMRHRNICVVGDPDQSIYAWRGATSRTSSSSSAITRMRRSSGLSRTTARPSGFCASLPN